MGMVKEDGRGRSDEERWGAGGGRGGDAGVQGWCRGGGDVELQRQKRVCCWVQGLEGAASVGTREQEQRRGC